MSKNNGNGVEIPCPTCGGSGMVTTGSGKSKQIVTCPRCNGTGK